MWSLWKQKELILPWNERLRWQFAKKTLVFDHNEIWFSEVIMVFPTDISLKQSVGRPYFLASRHIYKASALAGYHIYGNDWG